MTARAAPATSRAAGRIGARKAETAAPNSMAIVAKTRSAVAVPAPADAAARSPRRTPVRTMRIAIGPNGIAIA